jgi:hypothetical protein
MLGFKVSNTQDGGGNLSKCKSNVFAERNLESNNSKTAFFYKIAAILQVMFIKHSSICATNRIPDFRFSGVLDLVHRSVL